MNTMTMIASAGTTGLSIAKVLEGVTAVVTAVVDACTGNPITMAIVGMGLVGVGVGLFRKLLRVGR